jgi:hypothetical protein
VAAIIPILLVAVYFMPIYLRCRKSIHHAAVSGVVLQRYADLSDYEHLVSFLSRSRQSHGHPLPGALAINNLVGDVNGNSFHYIPGLAVFALFITWAVLKGLHRRYSGIPPLGGSWPPPGPDLVSESLALAAAPLPVSRPRRTRPATT